jgi:hypothetical protein
MTASMAIASWHREIQKVVEVHRLGVLSSSTASTTMATVSIVWSPTPRGSGGIYRSVHVERIGRDDGRSSGIVSVGHGGGMGRSTAYQMDVLLSVWKRGLVATNVEVRVKTQTMLLLTVDRP